MRLGGKNAIISGAGSGIGRAIAIGFAAEGAGVVVADIIADRARSTTAEIREAGGKAEAVTADVSHRRDVEKTLEAALACFERIHILVSVAGVATVRPFLELPEAEWDEIIAVNLKSQYLCGQVVGRHMAERGGGSIINVTSQLADVAQPLSAHYQASKGGGKMLTKSMALDLAQFDIRVNALAPGLTDGGDQSWMDTDRGRAWRPHREKLLERIPMHRTARPEEMADRSTNTAGGCARVFNGDAGLALGGGSMRVHKIVVSGSAALAVCGVLWAAPAAGQAGPAATPTWTEQAPAVHPLGRSGAAMAYDTATGTAVLFGGIGGRLKILRFADTWTWNGTTWANQAPAVHPPALINAAMAYDAATGTVVLFGGSTKLGDLGQTWTWDGTTWTKRTPAASPSPRIEAGMAYDAATGTVVLFGGFADKTGLFLNDTWTWDGTTWTKQAPAASPPAWAAAGMAYDAATRTVVVFGGPNGDTWTWDGTTWTKQAPAASPSARAGAGMAYDAATGTVVLFGGIGYSTGQYLGDTWTWDGTTWTKQAPAASPAPGDYPAMAYDAATSSVVLFGGYNGRGLHPYHHGTWTWG